MGGQNHQPCSKYVENSTKLSRFLSLAYAELELGNVALEDLILTELGGGRGSVEPILARLHVSREAINEALLTTTRLREQMDANDFLDLPGLRTMDLDTKGAQLAAHAMVSADAWKRIAEIMQVGGFYAVLPHFAACMQTLLQKTETLIESIGGLAEEAARGEVTATVETNRPRNIKQPFAELYTAWKIFQQDFLASALLSTELWYASRGYGSLVPEGVPAAVHA